MNPNKRYIVMDPVKHIIEVWAKDDGTPVFESSAFGQGKTWMGLTYETVVALEQILVEADAKIAALGLKAIEDEGKGKPD